MEIDLRDNNDVKNFITEVMNYSKDAKNENYSMRKIKSHVKNYKFKNLTSVISNKSKKGIIKRLNKDLVDFIYEYKFTLDVDKKLIDSPNLFKDYNEKLEKILLKYTESEYERSINKFLRDTSETKKIKNLGKILMGVLILDILGLIMISFVFLKLLYDASLLINKQNMKFINKMQLTNKLTMISYILISSSLLLYIVYYLIEKFKKEPNKSRFIYNSEQDKIYNSNRTYYNNKLTSLDKSSLPQLLSYKKIINLKYNNSIIFKIVKLVDRLNELLFPLPGIITILETLNKSYSKFYFLVIFIIFYILWATKIRYRILNNSIFETTKLKKLNDEIDSLIIMRKYHFESKPTSTTTENQDEDNKAEEGYLEALNEANEILAVTEGERTEEQRNRLNTLQSEVGTQGTLLQLAKVREGALKKTNSRWNWVESENEVYRFITNEKGQFEVKGLTYLNDYKAIEVKAPERYVLANNEDGRTYKFNVNERSYDSEESGVKYDSEKDQSNNAKRIDNQKVTIPQTGGIGSLIFVVAGLALMAVAFVAMKRRNSYEA